MGTGSGGGVFNRGSLLLKNTILAENGAMSKSDIFSDGTLSGAHNLIGDGAGQSVFIDGVDGNLVGTSAAPIDPMLGDWTEFYNGQWGYDLLPGSPAINAGSNELLPADRFDFDHDGDMTEPVPIDLAGTARISDGTVDIGARESVPEVFAVFWHSPQSRFLPGQTDLSLLFSRELTTLSTDDVTLVGPDGAVAITSVARIRYEHGWSEYAVEFDPLAAIGEYQLTVMPTVQDAEGGLLDQDLDGTSGEAGDDRYVARWLLAGSEVVARPDHYTVSENATLSADVTAGVLANDFDVDQDGDPLQVVLIELTAHGELVIQDDGSFTYTPAANFNREDTFRYVASDGIHDSAVVTVFLTVSTIHPQCNGLKPSDVDDNGTIAPQDALWVINALNRDGVHEFSNDRPRPLYQPFYDTNRDGWLTPVDALQVINHLQRNGAGEGEAFGTVRNVTGHSLPVAACDPSGWIHAGGQLGAPSDLPSLILDTLHESDPLVGEDLAWATVDELFLESLPARIDWEAFDEYLPELAVRMARMNSEDLAQFLQDELTELPEDLLDLLT